MIYKQHFLNCSFINLKNIKKLRFQLPHPKLTFDRFRLFYVPLLTYGCSFVLGSYTSLAFKELVLSVPEEIYKEKHF